MFSLHYKYMQKSMNWCLFSWLLKAAGMDESILHWLLKNMKWSILYSWQSKDIKGIKVVPQWCHCGTTFIDGTLTIILSQILLTSKKSNLTLMEYSDVIYRTKTSLQLIPPRYYKCSHIKLCIVKLKTTDTLCLIKYLFLSKRYVLAFKIIRICQSARL